ncbi:hypothetical protein V5799_034058 [Amblyomma americanum]|uniref:Metalloendopeptidase n=1 Tax=Amblyomma americanum TaxID=6943 RepID=A0AAQ4DLJ3_AMBAM
MALPLQPALWPNPANLAPDGMEFFEGDMLFPGNHSEDRAVVPGTYQLWPQGIIPVVIHPNLAHGMPLIRQAVASIQAKSCLRFVSRTTQRDYVHIFPGRGCYSAVGRQGSQQQLSLGTGCLNKGTVVHELLHAAGFFHEHSRSDRDQYIVVFRQNVVPEYAFNFEKMQPWQHRLLTPFDKDSIMLYGSYAGSRAPGLYTMLARDGSRLREVPDKPGLSDSDARRIRILYQCP